MNRRSLAALACLVASTALFALAVLEISFPGVFSIGNRLDSVFPTLWRYRIHIGVAEVLLSGLLLWPSFRLDAALSGRVLETVSRLGLGGMFIFASWFKIQNPQQFALLVVPVKRRKAIARAYPVGDHHRQHRAPPPGLDLHRMALGYPDELRIVGMYFHKW